MSNHLVSVILSSLEQVHHAGYWIAFFAAFFETTLAIGLILPGSTLILILGALAARGSFDPWILTGFAFVGAVLGDNMNYLLGERYGGRWLKGGFWFLRSDHVDRARAFMNAHGARSVFLGRFIPSIKEIAPFIAGTVHMNRRTFLFWNVLGAAGWAVQWVFAGYFFGQSLKVAQLWLSRAGLFFAFVILFSICLYFLRWLVIRIGRQVFAVAASLWQSVKEAVLANGYVVAGTARYPRAFAWLRARLDPRVFMGLPLSLLTLAFVYVLVLFAGIVEDVITSDPIVAFDMRMEALFAAFRTVMLTRIFTWITLLASFQVVVSFLMVFVAILLIWRKQSSIAALFIGVAGSELFTSLGKLAFHRPRPELALYLERSFSFPSGHSTIAVSFYGFAGYLLIRLVPGWRAKVNLFFTTLLVIVAIGFSRLYLGVHYVSDVVSGYLVGAMWLIIAIAFAEWRGASSVDAESRPVIGRAFALTLGLVGVALAAYVGLAARTHLPLAPHMARPVEIVSSVVEALSHEPLQYTETPLGEVQEPINVIFLVQDDAQLVALLRQAGWRMATPASFAALMEAVRSLVLRKDDSAAPLTPSFWNGRIQDVSFVRRTGANWLCNARHLRVWRTDFQVAEKGRIHVAMVNGVDRCRWGVIPRIDPDLDRSREQLREELTAAGPLEKVQEIPFVSSMSGENFLGDRFFTDGKAIMVTVR